MIWLYGKHSIKSVILKKRRKIHKILITKNNQKEFQDFILSNKLNFLNSLVSVVESKDISSNFISDGKILHQGFAALCSPLQFSSEEEFIAKIKKKNKLDNKSLGSILILDQLTDPQNIGAIIRSSVAFNIKNLVFLKRGTDLQSAIISKTSSGVIEEANIILVNNISNFIKNIKALNYWVAGLDGSASNELSEMKKYDNLCLIIGNEGSGIRTLVKKNCDLLLRIPISHEVESLNVSNAAAIALYEMSLGRP